MRITIFAIGVLAGIFIALAYVVAVLDCHASALARAAARRRA